MTLTARGILAEKTHRYYKKSLYHCIYHFTPEVFFYVFSLY